MKEEMEKKALVHPICYPNPSIAEAICEIHFNTDTPYSETSIKGLEKLFISSYPNQSEKKIKQYHATINETGVSVDEAPISCQVFKHHKRNHLIQIFPGIITINEIENYPGWNTFSNDLSFAWKSIKKVLPSARITRISLRYINLIPKKSDEKLSKWLKQNKYYPNEILNNSKKFLSRCEFNMDEDQRLIVTLAESTNKDHQSTIFDLEAFSQIENDLDWEAIYKKIESLHETILSVFLSSLEKEYQSFLNRNNT